MQYPIYTPDIASYTTSIQKAITDGWISSQGEFIAKAESLSSNILGSRYVVLVNNGTSATHLLYKSIKFKFPDIRRIYVPDFVFVAVWNCALYEYTPEQISVLKTDPLTLNMWEDEEYIRSLEPNSAVVVVHNIGNVVNVAKLQRMRPDLVFVEDCCEAFLESYEGSITGTKSLCAALSFFGNKLVTTGEGGLYYTNDKELYDFIYKSVHHGSTTERYVYDVLGYNYRMTNLQAALLYDQLLDVETILTKKRNIYSTYKRLFGDLVSTTGLWMMILRLPGLRFNELASYLANRGVDTRPMFYEIQKHSHLQSINTSIQTIGHEELVMIPSSPTLSAYDQTYIWSMIEQYKRGITIDIRKSTTDLLKTFLSNGLPETFRYFNTRDIQVCEFNELSIMLVENDTPFGYAHIDDTWVGICILPGYQYKGYGRFLIDFIISYAKAIDIPLLRLAVDKNNTHAIHLYLSSGFVISRQTHDVFFMEKTQ